MRDRSDSNNKHSIASDLNDIASLLTQYGLVSDPKGLYEASSKVLANNSEQTWSYHCNGIAFAVEGAIAGSIPRGISCYDVNFNVSIEGIYFDEKVYCNPLNALQFDIEILGLCDRSSDLYASWHLDKHIRGEEDHATKFSHPEYHLTFGGHNMENRGDVFGESIVLPAPRIFYPPMDAILGIDFIIQNYIPLTKRKNIMMDSKYKDVVSNSQYRLWKPYFTSMTSNWHSFENITIHDDFQHSRLNPFLGS